MTKILLVEDSIVAQGVVGGFLKRNGFDVIVANDGLEGISMFNEHQDIKLILSDINMPNMDGLTMVEKIRKEYGNHAVNIIMLTTEDSNDVKARGKVAGVTGWINKPFDGTAVVDIFRKLAS